MKLARSGNAVLLRMFETLIRRVESKQKSGSKLLTSNSVTLERQVLGIFSWLWPSDIYQTCREQEKLLRQTTLSTWSVSKYVCPLLCSYTCRCMYIYLCMSIKVVCTYTGKSSYCIHSTSSCLRAYVLTRRYEEHPYPKHIKPFKQTSTSQVQHGHFTQRKWAILNKILHSQP